MVRVKDYRIQFNEKHIKRTRVIRQRVIFEERVKTTSTVYECTKHLVYEKVITE